MEFPGYYYSDSKFVPNEKEKNYIITLAHHIVPTAKNIRVQTTKIDRTWSDTPFQDLYPTKGKDMILKLMKPLDTGLF